MTTQERIAKNIRVQRDKIGLSQKAVADRLGTYSSTISLWERGCHVPELKNLDAIAKALECETIDLLK